jgi:hypothetical protein
MVEGNNSIQMDISSYAEGIYQLLINDETELLKVELIVKTKK